MNRILPILLSLIVLAILVGANIYLSQRHSFYFGIEKQRFVYISFAAITVFMIGGLISLSNSTSIVGNILYVLSATIMAFTLYLLLSTLLVDLGGLFLNFTPKMYGFIALGLALIVTVYGMINTFNVRSHEHIVEMENLDEELRLAHWSDVHIGHFRGVEFLQKLVEQTNALDPDILVITGDMFDGRVNLSAATLEPMKNLKVPVYFVEGNHDKYTGVSEVKKLMADAGVHVLEDEVLEVKGLQLVGLNHMLADSNSHDMHAASGAKTMKEVLQGLKIEGDTPAILLHHSPDGIEYAAAAGIDLYLSGHTHGGQQFPVTLINKFLFKYNKGFYDYEGTKIFVSMGVGTFGPPVRVGTQGEVVLLRLVGRS